MSTGDPEPPSSPGVSEEWWSEAQQSIEESEYEVTWQTAAALDEAEGAWQAPNRAQDFRITFTGEGVRIVPRGEENPSWELGLALLGYGRGTDLRPVDAASLIAAGNRVDYTRAGLAEWYVNDATGLEQGFTLPGPPEMLPPPERPPLFHTPGARRAATGEDGSLPAFLIIELSGNLLARLSTDGRAVEFAPVSGGFSVVRYADLRVFDATGRQLPAWMEGFHEAGTRGVRLVWDDRDAVYPVTVDPLATSASWSYESDRDHAQLGYSVAAAGDVNGDGFDDVIVGAPYYSNGETDEGRAYLFRGSPSGLSAAPSWTVESDVSNAFFGQSVASAGDVNFDGYDDVIIGAPGYDGALDGSAEGRVYVYYGGPGGLQGTESWKAEGGAADLLGSSVACAGEVTGDGFDDVIVGAQGYTNGQTGEGGAFVYSGSSIGLGDVDSDGTLECGAPTPCDLSFSAWRAEANQSGARFGVSVAAAGNVDGDNYNDVIVGASVYTSVYSGEGAAFVFHGPLNGAETPAQADWHYYGGQSGAGFGVSVSSAGDVNDDDVDDVIVGAHNFDSTPWTSVGRAFLFLGSDPDGLPFTPVWEGSVGDQNYAYFGVSVGGAGDVDGDGFDDIIAGAFGRNDGATQEGTAFLYYGSTNGPGNSWAWEAQGNQYRARLGWSVAGAGDVNGDGFDDVIVGAPLSYRGQAEEGRALVFHGAAGITTAGLANRLGLAPGVVDPSSKWWVESTACTANPPKCDNRTETPDAVAYGPLPGSILLTTGRASDGGMGDTDWLGDGAPDAAFFELSLNVPVFARTLCFNAQFVTSESEPQTDEASFSFYYVRSSGSGPSASYSLSDLATTEKNPPSTYCIDTESDGTTQTEIDLEFRVSDGASNGANDSGLLLSRFQLRSSPMPPDVELDAHGCFHNPTPHDVSAAAGTYTYSKPLFDVPGVSLPFSFGVSYSSSSTASDVLGQGWGHTYIGEARKTSDRQGGDLPDNIMVRPGDRTAYFKEIDEDEDGTPDTPGVYVPKHGGEYGSLILNSDADRTVTYTTKNHQVYRFARKVSAARYLLTSNEDVNGNDVTLSYDTENRLEQVTDTRGHTFAFTYGGTDDEYLRSVTYDWTDGEGQSQSSAVTFAYDLASGYLRSITDLNGDLTTFTYTRDGRLLAATDADGITFVGNTYEEYQGLGLDQTGERLLSQRDGRDPDPFDPEAGIFYDYEDEFLVMTDRLGRQQTMAYDVKGRRAWTVNPSGVREEYTYDRNNNPVETRRRLPSETVSRVIQTVLYDDRGNALEQSQFPGVCVGGTDQGVACMDDGGCPESTCGVSGSMTYDERNNPRSQADHYGNTTTLDYDANDNLLVERDPLGNEMRHTYSRVPAGDAVLPGPTSTTDARGHTFTATYDERGYLTSATDPLGGTIRHTLDDLGRRTSTLDPEGDRLRRETGHDGGHRTCSEYDDGGRVIAETAYCGTCYGGSSHGTACDLHEDCPGGSCGLTVSMAYDARDNLLASVQPDGATSTYEYTPSGQPARETDPLGHSTRYEYDSGNRLVSVLVSNPAERSDGTTCPLVTAHEHDDGDRITSARLYVPDGSACDGEGTTLATASATYDEIGNRESLTDPNGNVTEYQYDLLQRLTREEDDLGAVLFTYDGRGLMTSRTTGSLDLIRYDYDAAGRLVEVDSVSDGFSIRHVLDENGNRVSSRRSDLAAPVAREFDALDRLARRTDEFGYTVSYEYDLAGNLTRLVYPSGVAADYEYDGLNRLIAVTDWDGRRTAYSYDNVGNVTSIALPDGSIVSYTYDAARRVTGIHDRRGGQTRFRASYTLNAAGKRIAADLDLPLQPARQTGETVFTPGVANTLLSRSGSSGSSSYGYDGDGKLLSGSLGGAPRVLTYNALGQLVGFDADVYRYGADGLRIETTRGTTVRRHVLDVTATHPRLLEERDGEGNVVARYLYGLGLIARDGPEGPRIYHYDSRGSTVALTDRYGTVTDRYAYDPYGLLLATRADVDRDGDGTADPTDNPFTYAGRDGVQNDGNGLYYMRARYYAPELGRFIQKDQIFDGSLTAPQTLNRYAYVEGDPILLTDPNGEFIFTLIACLVVAAVVATNVIVECTDGDGCDIGDVFETIGTSLLESIPVVGTIYQGVTMGLSGQWDWASFGLSIASDVITIGTLGVGAGLGGAGKAATNSARSFNKAWKGVRKAVDAGRKAGKQVAEAADAARSFRKWRQVQRSLEKVSRWTDRVEKVLGTTTHLGTNIYELSKNASDLSSRNDQPSGQDLGGDTNPIVDPQQGSVGSTQSCGAKCEVWR